MGKASLRVVITPVPVTQDYWAIVPPLLPQREPQVYTARASDGV